MNEQARIDALIAQNARLRAALEPFANEENWAPSEEEPGFWIFGNDEGIPIHDAPCDRVKLVLADTPAESLERMRAEAGRERAVRELEALMEQLKEEGFTFESQSAGLAGFGHSVAASAIGLCRVKIGRRLEEIAKERP